MTSIEGEKNWKGETRGGKKTSLPKEEKEEILMDKEKKFVENWGSEFEAKLYLKKRKELGSLVPGTELILEKALLRIEFSRYVEMYGIIKKTALNNIGLGLRVSEEAEKIFAQKNKKDFSDLALKLTSRIIGEGESTDRFFKWREEELKNLSTIEAADKVVDGLSEKEKSKYDEELFKVRLKLSKAMNSEEKNRSEKIDRLIHEEKKEN